MSQQPSRQTSFLNSLRHVPTTEARLKTEHNITLIDHTKPAEEPRTERRDSDASTNPPTPAVGAPLFKRLTNQGENLQQTVRRQISKQKYGRYGTERYGDEDDDTTTANTSSLLPPDDDPTDAPQPGEVASPLQTSYLERARAKSSKYLKRKRTLRAAETRETVLDILYENQRGFFFFGIPKYSASSLLPSDPKPWQNAELRTSPVDIRNAQVPDPSWEWVWKGWYVDMSRDVDEEGWEYSILFQKGWGAWHGNHPWFHSFVRRRRWVRLRRRKDAETRKTKEKAHELTAEYFTIHPRTLKAGSGSGSGGERSAATSQVPQVPRHKKGDEDVGVEKMEITSIATLTSVLRRAAVDREKLVAVRKFVASGGDELFYLSQRMPEIMSLFIYQSSRRRLLADLIANHDEAHEQKEDLHSHSHSDVDSQRRHAEAEKYAENLHKAVLAAERQVKRLEYWSDIKGMAVEEEMLHPERVQLVVAAGEQSAQEAAFASKQRAEEGVGELHSHPEHTGDTSGQQTSGESSSAAAPSKQASTRWFDAPSTPSATITEKRTSSSALLSPDRLAKSPETESSSDGQSLDRYTTAAESASEAGVSEAGVSPRGSKESRGMLSPAQKGKEKAEKLGTLDGVMDEGDEEADEEAHEAYVREVEAGEEGPDEGEGVGGHDALGGDVTIGEVGAGVEIEGGVIERSEVGDGEAGGEGGEDESSDEGEGLLGRVRRKVKNVVVGDTGA